MVFIAYFVHILKSVWLGINYLNKLAHMEILGRNKVMQKVMAQFAVVHML